LDGVTIDPSHFGFPSECVDSEARQRISCLEETAVSHGRASSERRYCTVGRLAVFEQFSVVELALSHLKIAFEHLKRGAELT
jgi:hypothetical protein